MKPNFNKGWSFKPVSHGFFISAVVIWNQTTADMYEIKMEQKNDKIVPAPVYSFSYIKPLMVVTEKIKSYINNKLEKKENDTVEMKE